MLSQSDLTKKLIQLSEDSRIVRLKNVLCDIDTQIYLVGGLIRDSAFEIPAKDIDLTTNAEINLIIKKANSASIRVTETGIKHNTITLLPVSDLPSIEITSFRKPKDDNSPACLMTDLTLRDFTVNAIAFSIENNSIIDPLNGYKDLVNNILRAPIDPASRFNEDPLRILRMVRLCATHRFLYDPITYEAAQNYVPKLSQVSAERVRDEFSRILLSPYPSQGLRDLQNLKILDLLFPEIAEFVDYEQNQFHKSDLFNHTLDVIEKTSPDLILRLAALLHDVGKPASLTIGVDGSRHFYRHESIGAKLSKQFLERLKFSKEQTSTVASLVKLHMRPLEAGAGGLRRLLRDSGEQYLRWRALKEADALSCKVGACQVKNKLKEFDDRINEIRNDPLIANSTKLNISGYDLIKLGHSPGPKFGKILKSLREHVIDHPEDNNADKLLSIVTQRFRSKDK
ncbi:MAG: HD domain-containing protein [Deltaproteobacteria bacterium]|nr:HD domain-containing protein [Deltaproteobacteria bacterium]